MTLWIIIATIIALIPIVFIKQYIITKKFNYLIFALLTYIILIICYINIFSNKAISSTYIILQILQILTMVVIGILLYKEKINFNKIIGIFLGIMSIKILGS
jgi:drug/metabolite transporter (DMT)-like permease